MAALLKSRWPINSYCSYIYFNFSYDYVGFFYNFDCCFALTAWASSPNILWTIYLSLCFMLVFGVLTAIYLVYSFLPFIFAFICIYYRYSSPFLRWYSYYNCLISPSLNLYTSSSVYPISTQNTLYFSGYFYLSLSIFSHFAIDKLIGLDRDLVNCFLYWYFPIIGNFSYRFDLHGWINCEFNCLYLLIKSVSSLDIGSL